MIEILVHWLSDVLHDLYVCMEWCVESMNQCVPFLGIQTMHWEKKGVCKLNEKKMKQQKNRTNKVDAMHFALSMHNSPKNSSIIGREACIKCNNIIVPNIDSFIRSLLFTVPQVTTVTFFYFAIINT